MLFGRHQAMRTADQLCPLELTSGWPATRRHCRATRGNAGRAGASLPHPAGDGECGGSDRGVEARSRRAMRENGGTRVFPAYGGSGRRTIVAPAFDSSTQADARRFRSRSSSRLRIRISTSPNAAGDPESGSRSSTVRHYSSTSRWRPPPEAESAGQPIGPRRVPAGSASANSPRLSQDGEASSAVVLRRCRTVDQRPQGSPGLLFGRWLLQIPARFVPASRGQSTKATRTTPPRAGTFRRTRGFIAGAPRAQLSAGQ